MYEQQNNQGENNLTTLEQPLVGGNTSATALGLRRIFAKPLVIIGTIVIAVLLGVGGYFFLVSKSFLTHTPESNISEISELSALSSIKVPPSKILLDDVILKNSNARSSLYVSDDASNVIYFFTATSGRIQIFANGQLSPEYDSLTNSIVVSDNQRLVVASAMRLRKDFVIANGLPSRPYDGINHAPILSPDGKHYAYVAFAGNKQYSVLNGKVIAIDDSPGANTTSIRVQPVFSGNSNTAAFVVRKGGHANILIVNTTTGSQEEEVTANMPGYLTFSDDGKTLGYVDKEEIILRDRHADRVTEKRFSIKAQSQVGKLVLSSDGNHWAYGHYEDTSSRKAHIWIDGNEISSPILFDGNILTLAIDNKGEKIAYELSGENVGVMVYNNTGNIVGNYALPNSEGRYAPVGAVAFLTNGSIVEMLSHASFVKPMTISADFVATGGVPEWKNILLINGATTTSTISDLWKSLSKKSQRHFLDLLQESGSWKDFDPKLPSSKNILTLVSSPDSQIIVTIRAEIDNPMPALYQGKSFRMFLQLGQSTTAPHELISLPIINANDKYLTFGSVTNGQILYNSYSFTNSQLLEKQNIIDMLPQYSIDRTKIHGQGKQGDNKGVPTEYTTDVTLSGAVAGVQADIHFNHSAGLEALMTVSIDKDVLGSLYGGDTPSSTTTQQFLFLKKYTGKHKLVFRVEGLSEGVRSDIHIENIRLLEYKK